MTPVVKQKPQNSKRITLKLLGIENQEGDYYHYVFRRSGVGGNSYLNLRAKDELDALTRWPKIKPLVKVYHSEEGEDISNTVLAEINRLCFP